MVAAERDGASLSGRIVERRLIMDHDGESGAVLERAVLDDGRAVVLKTFDPVSDLSFVVAGRVLPVDVELWQSGILDLSPPGLGHAVLGAWQEDGRWVLAMRDLSGSLLSYESRLSRDQYRTLIAAADAMHTARRGVAVDGLWPVEARVALFSPRVMAPYARDANPLPGWCLEGWQAWAEVAPAGVRQLVDRIHADPRILTGPLLQLGPSTLLHGDYWTPNLAFEDGRVIAIDWGLATIGPPVLEFVSFLVGCATQVDATHEELLDDLRDILGPDHEALLRIGLVFGVVEMGWNLAWQITRHPSPQATTEFDWWVQAALAASEWGLG